MDSFVCVCVHVCIYIYVCVCVYIYIYVYIYIRAQIGPEKVKHIFWGVIPFFTSKYHFLIQCEKWYWVNTQLKKRTQIGLEKAKKPAKMVRSAGKAGILWGLSLTFWTQKGNIWNQRKIYNKIYWGHAQKCKRHPQTAQKAKKNVKNGKKSGHCGGIMWVIHLYFWMHTCVHEACHWIQ